MLLDWVQKLVNSNEIESIGGLLNRIEETIRSNLLIESQLEKLLKEKSFKYKKQSYTLTDFSEIQFEDYINGIELSEEMKTLMKTPTSNSLSAALSKLSAFNKMSFTHRAILRQGMDLKQACMNMGIFENEMQRQYMISYTTENEKEFTIFMNIVSTQQGTSLKFDISSTTGKKNKRHYPEKLQGFVRGIDKSHIFKFKKENTEFSLEYRNLENSLSENEVEKNMVSIQTGVSNSKRKKGSSKKDRMIIYEKLAMLID